MDKKLNDLYKKWTGISAEKSNYASSEEILQLAKETKLAISEYRQWEERNKKLNDIYQLWGNQLKQLDKTDIDLCSSIYSKPYYISIPEKWFERDMVRVMIVGQEGRGDWKQEGWRDLQPENLADIEKIKEWHKGYLGRQLGENKSEEYNYNNSSFWQRFRKINELENCVCCWNNLDKIHRNGKVKCALTDEERKKLHSTEKKVLDEEINILNPNIVVFFGYSERESALKAELESVANKFYGKEKKDYEKLYEQKIYKVIEGVRTYIFTNHPAWRNQYKPKNYEDNVILALREAIKEQLGKI